jgi:CD63 antigen
MKCIKNLLFVFNLMFFLAGVGLIVTGVLVQTEYNEYFAFFDSQLNAAAILMIVVGSILFTVGFFGCCGAYKENRCMVIAFVFLVSIVFIVEISAAIAGHVMRHEIDNLIRTKMNEATRNYQKVVVREAWDGTQRELRCCGVNNYTDWLENDLLRNTSSVPPSCCVNSTHGPDCGRGVLLPWTVEAVPGSTSSSTDGIYQEGCLGKILGWFGDNAIILSVVGVCLGLIQLMGIILGWLLSRAIRDEQYDSP